MPTPRWWRRAEILGVAALTFVAAAATAVIPSLQASRIRPAQALRIVD